MTSISWVSVLCNRNNLAIVDNELTTNEDIDRTTPNFVTFVGKRSKRLVLDHLLKAEIGNTGCSQAKNISICYNTNTSKADCPIVAFDCELQRNKNTEPITKSTGTVRNLSWSKGKRNAGLEKSITNLLVGSVLAPFSSVMCYFSSDLSGLKGVADLLAQQAVQESPSDKTPGLSPRCLVIYESNNKDFDACKVEQNLLLRLYEAMKSLKEYSSVDEIETDISTHFHSIRVFGVQKSWDVLFCVKALRSRLKVLFRESRLER